LRDCFVPKVLVSSVRCVRMFFYRSQHQPKESSSCTQKQRAYHFLLLAALLILLCQGLHPPHGSSHRQLAHLEKLPGLLFRVHHGNVVLKLGVSVLLRLAAHKVQLGVLGGLQQELRRNNPLAAICR
jgi:hypothetical protein